MGARPAGGPPLRGGLDDAAPAMIPTIPAVMNANYDAVGVRITSLAAAIKNRAVGFEHGGT